MGVATATVLGKKKSSKYRIPYPVLYAGHEDAAKYSARTEGTAVIRIPATEGSYKRLREEVRNKGRREQKGAMGNLQCKPM